MKIYSYSQRRWLRSAGRRSRKRLLSQGGLPLSGLLWLPACFVVGILAGLLCSPFGLLSSFAASKEAYRRELLPPPVAPEESAAPRTSGPLQSESLLLLPREAPEEESSPAPVKNGLPLVCVYCTHAGEEYKGQTRVNGQPGGVMQAAAALVSALEERGVGVIFDETLHDSPSYDEAYGSSLRSISAIREENPSVELYIDVHRDSPIEGLSTRLETEEGAYARMMFIIGTNEKLEHPLWQQNHSFALELDAALNELLPGVTREPRVYSGRYNQHISPEAILVEVGSTENSVEEAERSAALLAEAICAVKGW